jgi:large subunit ribosomal protein L30
MEENSKSGNKGNKFAIIRIRGSIGVNKDIEMTLEQLRLYRKNYCVVVPDNQSFSGMILKVNDYVTWGEVDEDTLNLLADKKGEEYTGRKTDTKNKINYAKFLKIKGKDYKKFFRLNSPKKGFGRKGIKIPYSQGGALGYRGDRIKDLIKRMI